MNRSPLVLAIEPDLRQGAIVKRVVKERVQAEIVVVDSKDAAIAAIQSAIPDVLLVSALLSPRDEDEVIAHLRTLEGAGHLQTHTIPQLASALGAGEESGRGGLLSAFRRKKPAASAPAGCDPDMFADEIRTYLQRAAEKKREAAESGTVTPLPSIAAKPVEKSAPAKEQAPDSSAGSSWASPFEWRPSSHTRTAPPPPSEPPTAAPEADVQFATPEPEFPLPEPDFPLPEADVPPLEANVRPLEANVPLPSADVLPEPETLPVAALPAAKIHVPAPLSVWARKEAKPSEAPSAEELNGLFARLGVPDSIAWVAYPEGVRIRRVRVRVAKESHPSLQGAVLLGKRMLAELSGSDRP